MASRSDTRAAHNMPSVVGLCPVHRDHFYVPHEGACPEPGCDRRLVLYAPDIYRKLYEKVDGEAGEAIRDGARLERELDSVVAERDRYREALRTIAGHPLVDCDRECVAEMIRMADEALNGSEDTDG